MQVENYREKRGFLSQSAIKQWAFKSPLQWKKLWIDGEQDLDKNEDAFVLGSLVDTLAFTPELIEERFFVGEEKLPSAEIALIVKDVYARILRQNELISVANEDNVPEPIEMLEMSLKNNEEIISEAALANGWNSGWKIETRIAKIIEKGEEYFNSLVQCKDRKIISSQMNLEAIEIVNLLQNDTSTTYDGLVELYIKDYFVSSENVELIFQHEVFIKYQGIPLKGALDIIKIDHKNKTVQVVDFKTAYSAYEFIGNAKKYGYCAQLSFYNFLLKQQYKEQGLYQDYTFLEPMNLVIDIKDRVCYPYKYNPEDLYIAENGNAEYLYNVFEGKAIPLKIKKGWKQIIEEISWHIKEDKWQKPRELYEKGYIELNLIND